MKAKSFCLILLAVLAWLLIDDATLAGRRPARGAAEKAGPPYLLVLGIAQDGGVPQTGNLSDPAWDDVSKRRSVACLALVDPVDGGRWMFDATPDIKEQLHALDLEAPTVERPGLKGIFLTHAHIGHYLGLALLGHESMGARDVPVYTMPRMASFLRQNGPWDQLVRYRNVELLELTANKPVRVNPRITVTPIPVPHRQEYSEVVGYRIQGPLHSALYIPDIDSWETWDAEGVRIEDEIEGVDYAFLDGSFFSNGEIPGRDMSGFPHPFITHSMERFAKLSASERSKIRFIHFNHTNPVLDPGGPQNRQVRTAGFGLAVEGERLPL